LKGGWRERKRKERKTAAEKTRRVSSRTRKERCVDLDELTISLILSSCRTFQNLFPGKYTSNDSSSPGGSFSGETSLETTSGSSVSPFERVAIPPSPSSEKATRVHSRGTDSSSSPSS